MQLNLCVPSCATPYIHYIWFLNRVQKNKTQNYLHLFLLIRNCYKKKTRTIITNQLDATEIYAYIKHTTSNVHVSTISYYPNTTFSDVGHLSYRSAIVCEKLTQLCNRVLNLRDGVVTACDTLSVKYIEIMI